MADRLSLDRTALDAVLAPFGENLTLPGEVYHSADVFAFDLDRFFTRGWVCVGRSDEIAQPGQARAVRVGTEPLLVVRDESGSLRAFYNVCRHRGHELLPMGDAVDLRAVKCPYHAWTYGLDGTLKAAPTFTRTSNFDKNEYPLIEAGITEWNGFLFIDPSGEAGPFARHVGNLEDVLRRYQLEGLRSGATHRYEIAANWKLVVENYHECYHCASIHPALCRVSPPDSGRDLQPTGSWCGGTMDLMEYAETMSFDGSSAAPMLPALDEQERRSVLYIGVMPNLLISAHPDYVMTHRLTPLAPDRTQVECEWLFASTAFDDSTFDGAYAIDFWDVTNREDWGACEAVQRGTGSRGYRQGRLSSWEATVYQFHTMIASAYLGFPPSAPHAPDRSAFDSIVVN